MMGVDDDVERRGESERKRMEGSHTSTCNVLDFLIFGSFLAVLFWREVI